MVDRAACPHSAQVECCGWVSFYNWTENWEIQNSTEVLYPCSCEEAQEEDNQHIVKKGFCSNSTLDKNIPAHWPVHKEVRWCGAGGHPERAGAPDISRIQAGTQASFPLQPPPCLLTPSSAHI